MLQQIISPDLEPKPVGEKLQTATELLENISGITIKQDPQVLDLIVKLLLPCVSCCCCCFLGFEPIFRIGDLPEDKHVITSLDDKNGWQPTLSELDEVPKFLITRITGNFCLDIMFKAFCCEKLAPYSLELKQSRRTEGSYMSFNKSLALGGTFCCPHQAIIDLEDKKIGRVVQDFNFTNYITSFFKSYCLCKNSYKIQTKEDQKYLDRFKILVSLGYFGPHNNCCGATPWKNNMIWEVKDTSNNIVGRVQKTFGGTKDDKARFYWCCLNADNYVVEWEPDLSVEDKALLISTVLFLENLYYEQSNPFWIVT